MKITDVNLEEAAEESEQDRRDLKTLHGHLDELQAGDEDGYPIAVATRQLVGAGLVPRVDPVVIAKTLLIGDRDGGAMYQISARPVSLAPHEAEAEARIAIALREVADLAAAATYCLVGAVWIATQHNIERGLLRGLVLHARRRPARIDRRGYGAVDLVDSHGVQNRAWLVDAIDHASLPLYAPLELDKSKL